MKRLELVIHANDNGQYKAKEVIQQIIAQYPTLAAHNNIEETSLDDLAYNGLKCYKGNAEGVTGSWNNDKLEYMSRKFTLYFS